VVRSDWRRGVGSVGFSLCRAGDSPGAPCISWLGQRADAAWRGSRGGLHEEEPVGARLVGTCLVESGRGIAWGACTRRAARDWGRSVWGLTFFYFLMGRPHKPARQLANSHEAWPTHHEAGGTAIYGV
jgi:hypothetical protein